jgi:hypothetical protein
MPRTMVAQAVSSDVPASYRPASFSRILGWVDALPMHGWWAYPLLAVLLFTWSHAVLWTTGTVPVGTIQPLFASAVFYGPFVLAALAYVNHASERALASFWPATGWPDSDRAAWAYAFTTSPGGYGWLALVLGTAGAVGAFESSPQTAVGDVVSNPVVLLAAYLPSAALGYSLLVIAIVHTVHQLRLVARIHREATKIDPFDRVPLYAFSYLTFRTGLVYVIAGYYAVTVQGQFQAGNSVAIGILATTFGFDIACFVLPLWGIHERLIREKEQLLLQVEGRLSRLGEELYRRIDAGLFDGTKVVGESIAGVTALRDRINRIPTWPWPPNLLRGFLSALLIPVVVYLASRLAGGLIGA